jgi:uncharacterized membrane protein YdbT with pleckstrin-like domain
MESSPSPPAAVLAELRTDVRPFLWGIAVLVIAGLAALGFALGGAIPVQVGWPALGVALVAAAVLGVRSLGRRAVVYRVNAQRIEIERGYLGKRYESIDLFRVKDVVLEQGIIARLRGVGMITVFSTDQVEPILAIGPIPNAKELFQTMRDAVAAARRATGAAVLQ